MTVKCSQRATLRNSWAPNINMHLQHHNPIAIQSHSSIKHPGTVAAQMSRMAWIFSSDQKESRPIFCLRDSVLGFSSSSFASYSPFTGGLDQVKEASSFLLLLIVLHPTCVQLLPPFFPPTDFFNADLRCIRTCSLCSCCVPDHPEKRYRITMAGLLSQSFYAHFLKYRIGKKGNAKTKKNREKK